ncbi:hypothetical protein [Aeromicrobium fastidiosum]|uniref:Uncharacterized protein n=1 Tax=Aeromicrobium fastidiosum TaxID=52699 RepID=A0A641AQ18_9ACTN|nr:hypothetical protein [Aeromicrobium fastidiosum]KAA1380035.1 hypothetical protein ESP62_002185 [Aeromicrobium fastidiosum]MBP2389560.1 hypothetical protein [Aeromicrobium fastidiosum]
MRTSTITRAGAVLTASALAFSLGAGPVSAAETDTQSAGVVGGTSVPVSRLGSSSGVSAAGTITALRLGSGVITSRPTTQFLGNVAGSAPDNNVQTDVRINGRPKGRVMLYPGAGNGGVEIPRQWGSGKVQLGPTYFSDGTVSPVVSNTFYARKQVTTTRSNGIALKINRRNSKVTFRALSIKVINPSSGQFQSVKRVKLQRLKGSKWKTVKTIKLNSKGSGSYKATIKSKYRYRLYTTRTATQEKFETIKTGRI